MAEPLYFSIKLTDMFSPKLAPIARGLGDLDKQLGQTEKKVSTFGSSLALGGLDFGALAKGGRFFTFDLASGIGLALGLVKKLIGAFADLTKSIVKTAADAQDLNLAMRMNLGTEGAADIQNLADGFAQTTRLDDDEVKKLSLSFSSIGIKSRDAIDNIVTAASDLMVKHGNSREAMDGAIEAFRKIALKDGQISDKMLAPLDLSEKAFLDVLARMQGKKSITSKEVKALAAAGKLSGDTMLAAALQARAEAQGGIIGIPSLQGADTLGGTLHRLSNATGNMFKQIADGPGMKAVQGALDRIVNVMTGPAGTRFVGAIDKLLTKLGDVVTPDRIEAFLTAITDGVTWVVDKLTNAAPGDISWLDKFVIGVQASVSVLGVLWDIISGVAGALGWLVDNFVGFFTWMSEIGQKINAATAELGANIWRGLVDGITGGIDAVKTAVSGLGDGAIASLKNLLGIASPSKVMAGLGLNTAEGFALGVESGDDRVRAATQAAIGDTVTQPIRGGARAALASGGGGVSIQNLNIILPDITTNDPEGLARALGPAVRVELARVLDEAAMTGGDAKAA